MIIIVFQSFIIYSAKNADDRLLEYIHCQNHCFDIFEEYVNILERPFGIIRKAASDQPIFEPGITVSFHERIIFNNKHYLFLVNESVRKKGFSYY